MIIACLGDSLTEGDYGIYGKSGIGNVQPENYPFFLSQILNATVRNYGKCGYRSSDYLKFYLDGNVSLKDVDLIIIMLGTNGGQDPETDTRDNQDYRKLVELCKADAPNAKIILCTPPHVTTNPAYSNCGYAPQVEKAVAFVRNYAAETGISLIDTALCPYFTDETEAIMQPNDGLHFGETGYKAMAKFIAQELNRII